MQTEILVPAGANPHIYEPTPKQVEKILQVSAWFRLGEPIEQKILTVMAESAPAIKIVDLSEGIALEPALHDTCGQGHSHESLDRHIWLSPKLAQAQAVRIGETLKEIYPEHVDVFDRNLKLFLRQLEELSTEISKELAPYAGQAILVSHPAFGYYCSEFQLKQLSLECEGKDPLPQDVARIVKEAEESKVRVIFTQVQYNNKGTLLIAERLKMPVHEVDPYAPDYVTNLHHITDLISHGSDQN